MEIKSKEELVRAWRSKYKIFLCLCQPKEKEEYHKAGDQ